MIIADFFRHHKGKNNRGHLSPQQKKNAPRFSIPNSEFRIPNYFSGWGTTCTFRTSVVPLSPVPPAVTTTRSPALT